MAPTCKEIFSGWTFAEWKNGYRSGSLHPRSLFEAFDLKADDTAWITRVDEARFNTQLDDLAARLEEAGGNFTKLPLYGIPFAVKDNIDVAGWPTTEIGRAHV